MKMNIKFSFGRLHWAVIFTSFVLTIAAWQVSTSQIEKRIEQRFDFLSNQLVTQIIERMKRYENALKTGAIAIQTQRQKIDVDDWLRFSKALKITSMYPGINGIGVIYHIRPEEKDRFIKEQRALRPDFKIHPYHGAVENWPITYIEPLDGNEQAVGLDIAFEQHRINAAKKARDTSQTQITAPITLVQDEKKTPGFLQFVPLYSSHDISTIELKRQHFIGHVYAPFIMHKLISGTFNQKDIQDDNRHIRFSIYDGDELLYDDLKENGVTTTKSSSRSKKITIEMYSRTWTFNIQTASIFDEEMKTNQSTYVLIGGITIDVLLIFIFIILTGRDKRSLILVDEMTRRALVNEEYFRHVIEAAPCGMIITNDKGLIEEVNPHALALFGYSKEQMLRQSIDMLVPHRFSSAHSKHREGFYKHQENRRMGIDRNVSGLKSNGDEFPAEIGLAHFNGEGGTKILATIINMTEYVSITDELKRSNKDLNEFAYVASHDLKAPLRGIMQLASWIYEDIEESASDETKTHLKLLQSRTARLEKLLDDLLIYSRVGNHLGDIEEIDVSESVQMIFQLLDPPEGFVLNLPAPLPIMTTLTTPLEVIFRNLIGNAIKHHDKTEGVITITMIEKDNFYEFFCENDGPPIAPQHHDQIFEMFKTLRPRDEVEGSGMGLSIIKRMLDYHGQKITIVSAEERGVIFSFTWPKDFTRKG